MTFYLDIEPVLTKLRTVFLSTCSAHQQNWHLFPQANSFDQEGQFSISINEAELQNVQQNIRNPRLFPKQQRFQLRLYRTVSHLISQLCKLTKTLKTLRPCEPAKNNLQTKNANDRRFEERTKLRKFLTSRHVLQCIATCILEINQNKEMLSKRLSENLSLRFFCQA